MFKGKDGLAEILLEKAEQEERRRKEAIRRAKAEERMRREAEERRRLEEEERKRERLLTIRRRRLREERERRELERKLQEATWEANRKLQAWKREKIEEYVRYYGKYHAMKETSKVVENPRARWAWEEACEKIRDKWPEPYRSKCQFTQMELAAFQADPYQAARWIGFINSLNKL